ncbi:MAG: hypothetical protein IT320_06315 [Anaerolineae bacterium]|nr:hypothetical protein [Anaerolineae bacterium]
MAAIALALPIILLTPLLSGQLPGTHDAELHLHRLIGAALNWHEGVIWGRWTPQLHFGYGYPIGNFYAPGWHVAGGALVALGASAVGVWLLVQTLGILIYTVGGYLWGRQIGGRAAALVGAAVFTYAPLRFFELFSQGNLSQFLAMGLMAWVMWALARCARGPTPARMATAALLLAALIVTHHVTALIFVPVAAVYALLAPLIAGRRPWPTLIAFALGLLVAALYWLPAGLEIQYVGLQGAANQYPYLDGFIPLPELLAPVTTPDPAALNPPFPISVGVAQLVLAGLGLLIALVPRARLDRWQRIHAIAGALGLIACVWLVSPGSARLWATLTPMQNVLFPWRFLGVAALSAVPGAVVVTEVACRLRPVSWIAIALVVALALPVMAPRYPNVVIDEPVTPGTSIRYESISGNLGAVATAEYTPRWAQERPLAEGSPQFFDDWRWNVYVLRGSLPDDVTITSEDGAQRTGTRITIDAPQAFALDVHQFYFPGWAATLDGAPVEIAIAEPYGTMRIQIPAGEHTLEVWYAGTDAQHTGDLLTLAGLAICGLLLTRRKQSTPTAYVDDDRRTGWIVAAAAIVFALVYAGMASRPSTDAPFTPPQNLSAAGGTFADAEGTPQIELLGVNLSQTDAIQAGDWLYVDLYWRALGPLDPGWRFALTLIDPTLSLVWAQSDTGAPGGFDPTIWPSDRYVVDRHVLRIREDGQPYVADLALRIYNEDGDELTYTGAPLPSIRILNPTCPAPPVDSTPVSLTFGDAISLRTYSWEQDGDTARLRLDWTTKTPSGEDYALFIHFMRGDELLLAADRSPLDAYPSYLWTAGQCLVHYSAVEVPPGADRVLIGFYDRATLARLPAHGSAVTLENDGLVIRLD